MKISELKTKTESELHELLQRERIHLRDLRFRLAGAQLKNIKEIHETKRTIARILTILNNQQSR